MHIGKEAIRRWLFEKGYPSRYTRKGWSIKTTRMNGKYAGYPVIIKMDKKGMMRNAIEFMLEDYGNK